MAAFSYTTGLEFERWPREGDVFQSKDTGNRWRVLGTVESTDTVILAALDGGAFGDGVYYWPVDALWNRDAMTRVA